MPRGGKRAGAGRKPSRGAAQPLKPLAQAIRPAPVLAASGITPDRVLRELARIGFADIRSVVKWTGNVTAMQIDEDTGEMQLRASNQMALVDSAAIDEATASAIAEVSQTRDGVLKIKMHGKQPALLALAKHLGLLQPQHPAAADEAEAVPGKTEGEDPWSGLLPN